MKITDQVWEFAEPLVQACGCSLWDVEYVREGGEWFLRLYLDKEGGVDIDDCEAVSRAVDPVLDEKDPIPESYRFEVCSAGLERQLKRPSDFERYLGEPVLVKLYRPRDGQKEFHRPPRAAMRTAAVTIDDARPARSRLTRRRSRSCGSAWSSNHEGEKSMNAEIFAALAPAGEGTRHPRGLHGRKDHAGACRRL